MSPLLNSNNAAGIPHAASKQNVSRLAVIFTWDQFAGAVPEMAAFGRALRDRLGAGFLATLRKDGSPRLHPVVPIIAADKLWVFV